VDIVSFVDYFERSYKTLSKAIGFLAPLYGNLSLPMRPNFYYDILAETIDTKSILKIKILCTECKAPSGTYVVTLRSCGGYGQKKELKKDFDPLSCDRLFIESPESCYLIPSAEIFNKRAISLSQFKHYKIIPS